MSKWDAILFQPRRSFKLSDDQTPLCETIRRRNTFAQTRSRDTFTLLQKTRRARGDVWRTRIIFRVCSQGEGKEKCMWRELVEGQELQQRSLKSRARRFLDAQTSNGSRADSRNMIEF